MADTSLMVIQPTMTGVILFAPGKADEALAEIKEKARAEAAKLDISTKENREALAGLAYKIARTKTATDKMRLELVADRKKELKAIRAEQERAERERKRKAEEEAERKRAANRAHAAKINNETKACLLNHTNLTAENAEEVIKAIAKGMVSHVSIQY